MDLIDTLWNVKNTVFVRYTLHIQDLIDTLWNVKTWISEDKSPVDRDLIDTLWNVKYSSFVDFSTGEI